MLDWIIRGRAYSMMSIGWISLAEYSNKYKVSISTLRRRIKSDKVEYSLEEGKYLLKDSPLSQHNSSSTEVMVQIESPSAPPQFKDGVAFEELRPRRTFVESAKESFSNLNVADSGQPACEAANNLLAEIKKAYSLILQEKEELILQLKEELTDLKTLVRVLEDENQRLKDNTEEATTIDPWLEDLKTY